MKGEEEEEGEKDKGTKPPASPQLMTPALTTHASIIYLYSTWRKENGKI